MLFGRGQWAVFGVDPTSLGNFQKALADPFTAFEISQLAASITTKFKNEQQTGINPYGAPRLDEKLTDLETISGLSELLNKSDNGEDVSGDLQLVIDNLPYVASEGDLSLGNNKYGFWLINNKYEDPTDPNSKKEQISYEEIERPFKFLNKEEKKVIEEQIKAQAVLNRSQFPVLVDFQHGRVYVASSNVDDVVAVQELLTKLGAKPFGLAWDFGNYTWPTDFLNQIAAKNTSSFKAAMKTRAEELARFKPDEVEKLEDKNLEKVVSTFFALAPLESELWAGLTTPARIRIHKPIDPVGVSNPSVAFSLLHMSSDAEVATAGVVFQELVTKTTKSGEEKIYRNDKFTIDINDNVNLVEANAAMLRGFDLPQFKKEIKTTIKAKGRITIRDFWSMWLQGIHDSILEFESNVIDVLELDKKKEYGLKVPEYGSSEVEND